MCQSHVCLGHYIRSTDLFFSAWFCIEVRTCAISRRHCLQVGHEMRLMHACVIYGQEVAQKALPADLANFFSMLPAGMSSNLVGLLYQCEDNDALPERDCCKQGQLWLPVALQKTNECSPHRHPSSESHGKVGLKQLCLGVGTGEGGDRPGSVRVRAAEPQVFPRPLHCLQHNRQHWNS